MCRACGSFYFLSMHPVSSGCVSKNDEIFALASFLLVLKSPVVQLSMINRGSDSVLAFPLPVFAVALSWTAYLLYHIRIHLSRGFQNFFQKSFEPAVREAFIRSLPQGLLIISHFLPLVKGVVKIFFGGLPVGCRSTPPLPSFLPPSPRPPSPSGEGGES